MASPPVQKTGVTSRFRPDAEARLALRAQLQVPEQAVLVRSHSARFDPQKDHHTLIKAARLLCQRTSVRIVMYGEGVTYDNRALAGWLKEAGLGDRCHLMGLAHDTSKVMPALDIFVLSSFGEGFPNVVGEAMACGVPCVVTDVGDSRRIVGETGHVVRPSDAAALAKAWVALLMLPLEERVRRGRAARARIEAEFSLARMIERTGEELGLGLLRVRDRRDVARAVRARARPCRVSCA